MHIAILETNTDKSAFARAHPRDGDKWRALLQVLRPEWQFTAFAVAKGEFPPERSLFDGWIIGGSPASVHDTDDWVAQLMALIRDLAAQGQPMFGACFGHQAIAVALGGMVGKNPGGWKLGLADMQGGPVARQYAAHTEQVLFLPPTARAMAHSAHCPLASFAIGQTILTTQYHPEMTHEFISGLIDHLASEVSADVIAVARQSLRDPADTDASARQIVAFFEDHAKIGSKPTAAI
jgi:GMP synthase-like glutamine amidotransferase